MFIDIMSSSHRYEPPKDPARAAAAKEGAGAEEEEEQTDALPDMPASKVEGTVSRQESLEQKLERLSVSLGKGQLRNQKEASSAAAQGAESLYSTF